MLSWYSSLLCSFLAGSLPGRALLHLRQLSLFCMITHLPKNNPLLLRAKHALLTGTKQCKSWFLIIRDICLLYSLPHPLTMLDNPPKKETFKKLAKAYVISYWEKKLRAEAALLPSLAFFHPEFHSLCTPPPNTLDPKIKSLWGVQGHCSVKNVEWKV